MPRNDAENNRGCILAAGVLIVFVITALICNSIGGFMKTAFYPIVILMELVFIGILAHTFNRK